MELFFATSKEFRANSGNVSTNCKKKFKNTKENVHTPPVFKRCWISRDFGLTVSG
jgi:hypothetical protein